MTDEEPLVSVTEVPDAADAPDAPARDTEQAGAVDATSATAKAASDGAGGTSRVAELEARVTELEGQLAREREAATDYMARWQRAQADFANYKRRAQQDQEQVRRALAAEAARLILPALDSLDRAFVTLPPTLHRFTWINGVALVEQQLAQTLSLTGLQPIAVEPGHPFDPAKHEAIGEVESAEHPAGSVAAVVQRGYHIEGYVLRPALVQLAKAAESAADTSASPVEASGGTSTGPHADSPIPVESVADSTSPPDGDVGAQPAAPSGTAEENHEPSAS